MVSFKPHWAPGRSYANFPIRVAIANHMLHIATKLKLQHAIEMIILLTQSPVQRCAAHKLHFSRLDSRQLRAISPYSNLLFSTLHFIQPFKIILRLAETPLALLD